MNFVKFLRTPFLQNTSGGCILSATNLQELQSINKKYYEEIK